MGIKAGFTQNDIRNAIRQQLKNIDEVIFEILQQTGEQFVADARKVDSYMDRTRNLRGSIGYIIIKDGYSKKTNLEGTPEGKKQATKLLKEVQAEYPSGWALIVVAGMNYAAYVEAKGFDVLTGSSQIASANLKRAFARLQRQISKLR